MSYLYIYIYKAEKLSVCLSAFFLCYTANSRTKARIDMGLYNKIKRSYGNSKFVVTNRYLLPFVLYKVLKALV